MLLGMFVRVSFCYAHAGRLGVVWLTTSESRLGAILAFLWANIYKGRGNGRPIALMYFPFDDLFLAGVLLAG